MEGEAAHGRVVLFPQFRERLLSPGIVRTLSQVCPGFIVAGDSLPAVPGDLPHGTVIVWLTHGCIIERIELATSASLQDRTDPIFGKLGYDYEMGSCGAHWVFVEDEGIFHHLGAGDHLTILNDDESKVFWKGRITPDTKVGLKQNRDGWMQPHALGRWILWTQKGFSPGEWARFFFQPDGVPIRGRLIRVASENQESRESRRDRDRCLPSTSRHSGSDHTTTSEPARTPPST